VRALFASLRKGGGGCFRRALVVLAWRPVQERGGASPVQLYLAFSVQRSEKKMICADGLVSKFGIAGLFTGELK
jgi:hypothetical protein